MLHGKFNQRCTMNIYWQCCCNNEITGSSSQRLHNVDTTNPNWQHCSKVASTVDSKFIPHHIIDDVPLIISFITDDCNRDFKFSTFFRRRYYGIATALCQLCEKRQMWTIQSHMVTFPQPCLKVVKKFNKGIKGMTFVCYTGSILGNQFQVIISLSYSKRSQKLHFKGLEISRMIICSLVAWNFAKKLRFL